MEKPTPAGGEGPATPEEPEGQPEGGTEHGEAVHLSYAEYEELKTLAQERDDYLQRLQRAVADYQNLQKRIERFRLQAREDAVRALAEEILPVADSLSRALEAAEQAEGGEQIVEGLRLVEKEFYGALAEFGIRPVQALGQEFDPHYHEAAMQEPQQDAPPNTVVRELKRGFVMGDVVIRPSQVVVAGPAAAEEEAGTED
jgi:molecular chaperone GrpE